MAERFLGTFPTRESAEQTLSKLSQVGIDLRNIGVAYPEVASGNAVLADGRLVSQAITPLEVLRETLPTLGVPQELADFYIGRVQQGAILIMGETKHNPVAERHALRSHGIEELYFADLPGGPTVPPWGWPPTSPPLHTGGGQRMLPWKQYSGGADFPLDADAEEHA